MTRVTFINKFPNALRKIVNQSDAFVNLLANEVYRISKMQVPKDKGDLLKSSAPGPEKIAHAKYRVQYTKEYARKLHDDMSLRIKKPGRKQHYLSDPGEEVYARAPERAKQVFGR